MSDPTEHLIHLELRKSVTEVHIATTLFARNLCCRAFGFGPVCDDGLGIGYILKDDAINLCVTRSNVILMTSVLSPCIFKKRVPLQLETTDGALHPND